MKGYRILLAVAFCIFIQMAYSIADPARDSMVPAEILTKAAEQGNPEMQVQLAVQWFLKAAEQGHALAQYYAGDFYRTGTGVTKNLVQAYKWFDLSSLAEGKQFIEAAKLRNELGEQMTPEQIVQARQLSLEWQTAHPRMPIRCGGTGYGVAPCTVGGDVKAPVLLINPQPSYTAEARKARIEGTVLLGCIVRKDGTVDSFKFIHGLGYGLDESAAKTIFEKWRFQPSIINGNPVDVQIEIPVTFRLAQAATK
jgi:TonB family protein